METEIIKGMILAPCGVMGFDSEVMGASLLPATRGGGASFLWSGEKMSGFGNLGGVVEKERWVGGGGGGLKGKVMGRVEGRVGRWWREMRAKVAEAEAAADKYGEWRMELSIVDGDEREQRFSGRRERGRGVYWVGSGSGDVGGLSLSRGSGNYKGHRRRE